MTDDATPETTPETTPEQPIDRSALKPHQLERLVEEGKLPPEVLEEELEDDAPTSGTITLETLRAHIAEKEALRATLEEYRARFFELEGVLRAGGYDPETDGGVDVWLSGRLVAADQADTEPYSMPTFINEDEARGATREDPCS